MKRATSIFVAVILSSILAGCDALGIFEDIGADPHPPSVSLLDILTDPPDPLSPEDPVTPSRPLTVDEIGYVLNPNSAFQIRVSWADAGGDIVNFRLRDRDGTNNGEATPSPPEFDVDGDGEVDFSGNAPEFFSGTAGVIRIIDIEFEGNQEGAHRMELWAVDSHGSRSEKFEFVISLRL